MRCGAVTAAQSSGSACGTKHGLQLAHLHSLFRLCSGDTQPAAWLDDEEDQPADCELSFLCGVESALRDSPVDLDGSRLVGGESTRARRAPSRAARLDDALCGREPRHAGV